MSAYSFIYLSPHPDDAVLSCGGCIWQQTQAGERVLVATIFASALAPDAPLSPFAQTLHTRWGHMDGADARRRAEDRAALALLGADVVHWPYADCIYRQTPDGHFPYVSEEALWGGVHPGEVGLVAELAARIAALPLGLGDEGEHVGPPRPVIYAPLAAGQHVDHKIVRRAVSDILASTERGYEMLFYEDYPYAEDPQTVQDALGAQATQWQAESVPLTEEALEIKIAAIAQYRSQISTFWTSSAQMEAAIRAFAEQVGGGSLAERYWRFERP